MSGAPPRIGHVSVYAHDPKAAAADLAALLGGQAVPFPPHAGAWVCFLSSARVGWEFEFIEIYPRTTRLAVVEGGTRPRFVPVEGGVATGAGSHVNLVLPITAEAIETACKHVGRPHGWRWPGLMDVWLDEGLCLVNQSPPALTAPKCSGKYTASAADFGSGLVPLGPSRGSSGGWNP